MHLTPMGHHTQQPMFYLLFFSEAYGRTMEERGYRYNLRLFKEIRRFWENREKLGLQSVVTNLAGNIIAFMPFGFFLPLYVKKAKNVFVCTILTAGFSLLVETVQLVSRVGAFDVDDLFLNAIGGCFGCISFYICRFLWRRRDRKKKIKAESVKEKE